MKHFRSIAAAQTVPVAGDVDANTEQHVRLAKAAGAEQAHVLVFPELSLTGYEVHLYGRPTGGLPGGGRSAIWSETGQLLAELEASGAATVIASESQAGWRAKTIMLGGSVN